jgi:hypothetical protein
MAKKKTTKLAAEFWRKDAAQRANADRILEIRRREREAGQSSSESAA